MGLRVQLTEETEKKFREAAMRRHGYGKGALSKAAEDAFQKWIASAKEVPQFEGDPVKAIEGILSDVKMGSVELQHSAKRLWLEKGT